MLLVIHKCITFNPLTHSLIRQISTQTPSLTAKCRMGTEHTEKVKLLDFPTDLKWKNSVGSGSCPSPPFLSGVQLKDIIIGIIFINRWASFQVFWLLPNPELFGRQCLGMKLSHRGSLRFPRVSNPIYPGPVGWTHSAPGSQPLWASMQTPEHAPGGRIHAVSRKGQRACPAESSSRRWEHKPFHIWPQIGKGGPKWPTAPWITGPNPPNMGGAHEDNAGERSPKNSLRFSSPISNES